MLIETIKSRITPETWMLQEHGCKPVNGRCKSFRPGASNPTSLSLDGPRWFDFALGKGGDVIDMVAEDKCNGDIGDAVRLLAKKLNIDDEFAGKRVDTELLRMEAMCTEWQRNMTEEHYAYLARRGITRETAAELRIGFCTSGQLADRLTIPYIVHGRVLYFIGREWHPSEAKYMKLKRTDANQHPIWGQDTLKREGPVFIAEGAFDAMSVYQEGYAVVSAITGAFSHNQLEELYPMLKGRRIIVCMDYDPVSKAGQNFTDKLAHDLFSRGFDVRANFLQGTGKVDVSELYAAHPCKETIQSIIDAAKPYGTLVCETRGQDEVEALLRASARRASAEVFGAMCSAAVKNERLDKDYIKSLCAVLQRPPTELTICNEFCDKFTVVFQPRMGWFVWNGVIWERIDENLIRRNAGDLCGRFQTSRLSEGVFKLLKARLCRQEMMDTDPSVIVFPNGEYRMDKFTFSEAHDPSHYSTVCMEYPYDPDARCDEFDAFVEDVTEGRLDRMEFIRQMFGYTLIRDARFQVAFCLLGEGSNGKSVLLKVLESMLGSVNCTHIEIASLNEAFQRIALMHSMANICNDMKSDVAGTESYFKAIVGGDPVNGCYKGKDFIDFKPYCKMIFSSNRMPTAREVNYSFVRRFRFLNFPVTYTDTGEHVKDPVLLGRLLKELPGVFNFAVQGAKNLLEDGKLVATCDQPANERDLIEASNPLITFLDDCFKPEESIRKRGDVVETYEEWCRAHSMHPYPPKVFWMRLKETCIVEDRGWSHDSRIVAIRPGKQWMGGGQNAK